MDPFSHMLMETALDSVATRNHWMAGSHFLRCFTFCKVSFTFYTTELFGASNCVRKSLIAAWRLVAIDSYSIL